ncbi:MAG: hypothetical protein Q8O54_08185 [Brevundimonas sp.]|nr:hypothetical protein [Brevundimonas sp.]
MSACPTAAATRRDVAVTGSDTLHEAHHFGEVGRGPCRIECLRTALRMLQATLTIH